MSRYVGYLFVCILWLFVPMGAWACLLYTSDAADE